eukprot:GHRQ01034110.1.p1 GENE.GHRQ01034110.1~~GHRQ01034110.1.p1  ORF type:complete len:120 (+),score=7.87 GHRQ01034110.1:266-625(+)
MFNEQAPPEHKAVDNDTRHNKVTAKTTEPEPRTCPMTRPCSTSSILISRSVSSADTFSMGMPVHCATMLAMSCSVTCRRHQQQQHGAWAYSQQQPLDNACNARVHAQNRVSNLQQHPTE